MRITSQRVNPHHTSVLGSPGLSGLLTVRSQADSTTVLRSTWKPRTTRFAVWSASNRTLTASATQPIDQPQRGGRPGGSVPVCPVRRLVGRSGPVLGSTRSADRVLESKSDVGRWELACLEIDTDQYPTVRQQPIYDYRTAIASSESRSGRCHPRGYFACNGLRGISFDPFAIARAPSEGIVVTADATRTPAV